MSPNEPYSGFLDLAQELVDDILSHVDLHQDLISFALVSQTCASLAIPRHTEYRILCLEFPTADVWKHLARCPTLASNIRGVHFSQLYPRKYPITLVDPVLDNARGESQEDIAGYICRALSSMTRLSTMTWHGSCATPSRDLIVEALATRVRLKRLSLMWNSQLGLDSDSNPTWSISGLTHLFLQGRAWTCSTSISNITKWVQSSPPLVFLHIWTGLLSRVAASTSFIFPLLTTLSLYGPAREFIIGFIERHPSIEELRWYPPEPIQELPNNFLPNVKRLQVSTSILHALEQNYLAATGPGCPQPTPLRRYKVEIIQVSLEEPRVDLSSFHCLEPMSLLVLNYARDSPGTLQDSAKKFPNIRWLEILPVTHTSQLWTIQQWLDILSWFPHLQTLGPSEIWEHAHANGISQEDLVKKLLIACPKFRYWNNYDTKRKGNYRLHIRPLGPGELGPNGETGDGVILYRTEKARPNWTRLYDPMRGEYDNSDSGYLPPPVEAQYTLRLHPV
ncbi:hypothetical protein BDN72DRAFT_156530 [Pluteus cervinus]|uniref:Uncharacterized protein n=1 Tax=Pluteus cervinus TaxID=181527 RepID=A0ACD3AMT7_9AGAR|nr:hypothetical protein BDN72DRAFT_156530 [Pluteus cervinus]